MFVFSMEIMLAQLQLQTPFPNLIFVLQNHRKSPVSTKHGITDFLVEIGMKIIYTHIPTSRIFANVGSDI